jgi:hypothetical protein
VRYHALVCDYDALPSLKARVDWVTDSEDGDGVGELIEALIANDLEVREANVARHHLLLGARTDGGDA